MRLDRALYICDPICLKPLVARTALAVEQGIVRALGLEVVRQILEP